MKKYYFSVDDFEKNYLPGVNKYVGKKRVIKYACPICDYTHEWDNDWDVEKKAEVKSEVDMHYAFHIIPDENTDISGN